MGRRPRVAAVSGAMRHEALTYGRAAAARPAGDGVGAAEEGRTYEPTEGRNPPPACGTLWRVAQLGKCARATPPPACGALWRMPQLGKRARATPRQPAGGLRQGPQASAWGLAARRGAVWAEGLADGAPWARPGHHQAASCGLRRCRELRIILTSRETVLSAKRPPAKGRLRVRVRSRSHPGRGVLTSAQRLRVRSPSRPALPLAPECSVSYVHHRVAV